MKLTSKMKQVIAEMMKIEDLCEADIFELSSKYDLSFAEEMNVYNMFQKSLPKTADVSISELLKEPEPLKPLDVYAPSGWTLTKGFGA